MNKLCATIIVLISLILIIFGNFHYTQKTSAIENKAVTDFQRSKEKEEKKRQKLINSLNPKINKNQTINDYFKYLRLTKGEIVISAIGSSVTAGAGASDSSKNWVNTLSSKLNSNFSNVTINNRGFSRFTTEDLLTEDKVDLVIKDKPDLVIFETALLNNYGKPISMEDTFKQIEQITTTIQENVPSVRILITSPNPSTLMSEGKINGIGYDYPDYVKETTDFIEDKGWEYVNVFEEINNEIKTNGLKVEDTLHSDGIHPNDTGYKLWFEILDSYISNGNDV